MSISDSALVVDLNISVWTANIVDRKATDELLDSKGANHTGGKFKKNLMAGTSLRKQIEDHAARCRLAHNKASLPWADKGSRLLPTRKFMDYKQEMNANKAMFDSMVQSFLDTYEGLIEQAQENLGDLFDASEYPDKEAIAQKFNFKLVFSPVPESGDFRLDVPQADLEEVRKMYEENFQTRIDEAMKEPWKRLHKMLEGMVKKLQAAEQEEKVRFHDSFISNAHDMCDMLQDMNITCNKDMQKAEGMLREALKHISDTDTIRHSEMTQVELHTDVKAILDEFEW